MEAMRRGGLDLPPLGGEGKVVEADETGYGDIPEARHPKFKTRGRPFSKNPRSRRKRAIIALVERGGEVRSFHVPSAHADTVVEIVRKNIARESRLHTDESKLYHQVGREFSAHETVTHSEKEYARGEHHTNTLESFWHLFKVSIASTHVHISRKHFDKYLREFTLRSNHRARENEMFDLLVACL